MHVSCGSNFHGLFCLDMRSVCEWESFSSHADTIHVSGFFSICILMFIKVSGFFSNYILMSYLYNVFISGGMIISPMPEINYNISSSPEQLLYCLWLM